jgi:excisionase family DNA binding protein
MEELLKINDVCKILNMGRWAVEKKIKEGEIKASKIGRIYRIKPSDINSFIERCSNQ